MAKTKAELLKDAKTAGVVADTVTADEVTVEELTAKLSPNPQAWEGSLSSATPIVAPDGHVNLSQADIEARDAAA